MLKSIVWVVLAALLAVIIDPADGQDPDGPI